jgi:hypothetical protein
MVVDFGHYSRSSMGPKRNSRRGLALLSTALAALIALHACKRTPKVREEATMQPPVKVDIIPGTSIGEVKLGARLESLPSRARIERPGGTLDGIHLLVGEQGHVDDIWIEDMHTFPNELTCQGKIVPRDSTVESLGHLFGGCEQVSGVKGGIFFNCANGLAIGTDFSRQSLQIRVKPMLTGAR